MRAKVHQLLELLEVSKETEAAEKAGEGRGVRKLAILYRGCSAQDATGFIHPSIERKDRSVNSLPMSEAASFFRLFPDFWFRRHSLE